MTPAGGGQDRDQQDHGPDREHGNLKAVEPLSLIAGGKNVTKSANRTLEGGSKWAKLCSPMRARGGGDMRSPHGLLRGFGDLDGG
jgi:hypothetical protein